MEVPNGLEVLQFKGKTYYVSEESYEKLYLYMFDMHHMDVPCPHTTAKFFNLLEECAWENVSKR